MNHVGIVIIGRNEGDRLRRCLMSVIHGGRVVYVDSGSSDESVTLARSLGVEVVELDMSTSFTAARARNAGLERLLQLDPSVQLVQFVDGDCDLAEGWLDRGRLELQANPRWAVVSGRLRERDCDGSIYNRLADLEWDTPIGQVKSCGGIAMMRVSAMQEAGGFDPTLIAGEEPELCFRLRQLGWTVWKLDAEMGWHDIAITRFGQWWRRSVRSGYGSLVVACQVGGPDAPFARQVRSARFWTVGWASATIAALSTAWWIGGPVTGLAALGVLASTQILQILRMAAKVRRRTPDTGTALAYGVSIVVGKWAELAGQLRYLLDRRSRRRSALIYKPKSTHSTVVMTSSPRLRLGDSPSFDV